MFGDGRGVCRLLDSLTPRRARARTGDAEDSREEDRTCPSLPSQHHWLVRPELDKNNKQQDHHHRESTSKWANEVWGESCSHTVSHILLSWHGAELEGTNAACLLYTCMCQLSLVCALTHLLSGSSAHFQAGHPDSSSRRQTEQRALVALRHSARTARGLQAVSAPECRCDARMSSCLALA